jgi:hypothetical protein
MRWPWSKKEPVSASGEQPAISDGPQGCLATRKTIEDGFGVYYMWRSQPSNGADSGWTFAHGTENEGYMGDATNSRVHHLATIAKERPEIVPYLNEPVGSAFYWNGSKFVPDPLGSPDSRPSVH